MKRAISRLIFVSRDGSSSFSVTAWLRMSKNLPLEGVQLGLQLVRVYFSDVFSFHGITLSGIKPLGSAGVPTQYKTTPHRHLMGYSDQCLLGHLFGHTTNFIQDRARLNPGKPKRSGSPLPLPIRVFQRLATNRPVRENSNVKLSLRGAEMRCRHTTGLNCTDHAI